MKFSHRRGYIDRESYVAQYLALAVFIAGVVSTIGSDDLLAAFAAGMWPYFTHVSVSKNDYIATQVVLSLGMGTSTCILKGNPSPQSSTSFSTAHALFTLVHGFRFTLSIYLS